MAEMRRATTVFREVLRPVVPSAAAADASRRRPHADATSIRSDGRNWRGWRADGLLDWRARPRRRSGPCSSPGCTRRRPRPAEPRSSSRATRTRSGRAKRARRGAEARSGRPARRRAATRARRARSSRRSPRSTACTPQNILLGCGSTQILRTATHVFTARNRALVGTIPTYEECAGYAEMMGHPVRAVPLDADFKMDLDRMAAAARGAGLVFYCNPSNPTATYTGARASRDFFARVNRISPETTILVDEAYFDYVDGRRSRDAHPARRRGPADHRRADVLEGVRHGRPPHRLRRRHTPRRSRRCRRGTAAPAPAR